MNKCHFSLKYQANSDQNSHMISCSNAKLSMTIKVQVHQSTKNDLSITSIKTDKRFLKPKKVFQLGGHKISQRGLRILMFPELDCNYSKNVNTNCS